jgi:flagellin
MISINVNSAASGAGLNLGKSNDALQKSLARLSSGRRIVTSSDDAGGLAVSMKMSAALKRTEATAINLANIQSYLQTQDGAFSVADKVLSRMSELTTLARDVTKNSGDVENYDKEFQNLQSQLTSLGTEKFNGQALFATSTSTGSEFTVPTSEDGSQSTTVTQAAMGGDPAVGMMIGGFVQITGAPTPEFVPFKSTDYAENDTVYALDGTTRAMTAIEATESSSIADGTETSSTNAVASAIDGVLDYENSAPYAYLSQMALQNVADMRAQNGAESSRIGFAQDLIKINAINLEAANSRIMDVDVAAESSQLARFQILQQAGTAMLAQANTSQQSLVKLLQG